MSKVSEWYADKTIFVTGATGFMGKILIEKLLRSCPDVSKICVLVRPKKGKTPRERIEDFFNQPIFDKLKETQSTSRIHGKIICVNGDVTQEKMGLTSDDYEILKSNVDVVFHMAANVRFDQPLRAAVLMNTGGTKNVLDVVKDFENLKIFMHVSTSYCHCDRDILEEEMYPAPHHPMGILKLVTLTDDDSLLTLLTPHLLKTFPNTYAYTKCLTEQLVKEYSDKIRAVIVRPSIVVAAYKDPIPGWVDNLNGPTGIMVGAGKGIIRSMHCNAGFVADLVPVDITINRMLIIAKEAAESSAKTQGPQAYNITADTANPVTWGTALEIGKKHFYDNPFSVCLWYPGGTIKSSYFLHVLAIFFLHYIPAYLIDAVMPICGQKPFLVNAQRRISTGLEVLQYYTTRAWVFRHEKIKNLEAGLTETDKKVFYSDMSKLNWDDYIYDYVMGARKYCMREGPETLPKARRLLKRLFYLDVSVKIGLVFILSYFLFILSQRIFSNI